jgi:hypothetical protein
MSRIDILKDLGLPIKPHLEQLERTKRWKKRLDDIRYSNSSVDKIPYQLDFIYAFFINCFHLRDFLKYSKTISDAIITKFFEDNIEMQICRDICNECKHCSLENPSIGLTIPNTNKKSASGWAGVCLVKDYDPFQEVLKNDNPIKNIKYVILAEGKMYNVFDLTDKCLNLWERFFKENSLQ